jgi:hypothetical protein
MNVVNIHWYAPEDRANALNGVLDIGLIKSVFWLAVSIAIFWISWANLMNRSEKLDNFSPY